MRKDNTAKESAVTRKRANRKLTVGIDLGNRSSRYCILDEQGEVLAEGSMATTKKGFAQVFGSKPRSRLALEVGTHSPCRVGLCAPAIRRNLQSSKTESP
jgi:transposase